MEKVAEIVSRFGGAALSGYFGIAVLVNVATKQQADFLEAVHLEGAVSAIVGVVLALAALYCTYLLLRSSEHVVYVTQVILGLVLFFAGAAKLFEPNGARESILAYRLGIPNSIATPLGYALPVFEIVLAVLLLAGVFVRLAAIASALLMVVFILAIIQVWARGYTIDCGCFGSGVNLDPEGRHLRYSLEVLRDIVFALMGGLLALKPQAAFSLIPENSDEEGISHG
ncbi:MAG: hypothetical protein RIS43_390 [Actinomycetota bacterium]